MATQTAKGPFPPWGNCSSSPCLTLLPQVDFREMRGPYGFRQSGGQARIKSVNTSGDRPVQTLSAVTTSTGPGSCSKKVRGKKTNTYVRVSSHIALLLVAKLLPDGSARPPNKIAFHDTNVHPARTMSAEKLSGRSAFCISRLICASDGNDFSAESNVLQTRFRLPCHLKNLDRSRSPKNQLLCNM